MRALPRGVYLVERFSVRHASLSFLRFLFLCIYFVLFLDSAHYMWWVYKRYPLGVLLFCGIDENRREAAAMTDISNNTSRLFALPSFGRGMARVLDVGSTLDAFNDSRDPFAADYAALRSDWLQVGEDIRLALEDYRHG
jgi:hypothetical protein